MNSRITQQLISVGLIFILTSCTYEINELSQENAEYLLNEYDTLIYLYNQTDTCKVNVDSYFVPGSVYYTFGLGIVTDDSGVSEFYLPYSIYHVSLKLYGKIDKVELWIKLKDKNSIYYNRSDILFIHNINKSDLITNRTILTTDYNNCYIYDSNVSLYSNYAGIQNFVYNKKYGLVQLIMKDSTRFELIGAK